MTNRKQERIAKNALGIFLKMGEGMAKMLEAERNDERIIYDLGNCKDV